MLGREQKAWLKERLTRSTATWKIWGATNGTLDMRTDPQNLPAGLVKDNMAGQGFRHLRRRRFQRRVQPSARKSTTLVRDRKVSGFVTVSGDRHSFWAGYAAPHLPPAGFDPVGLSFITGSISAPGLGEAAEYLQGLPAAAAVRAQGGRVPRPSTTINLTIKRGVRAALEYAASGDIAKARALTNPDVAPHLEFVDMAGHGYAVVTRRRRCDRYRIRLHRPPDHARDDARRRPAALPRIAPREAVAAGHAAEAGAAGA